MTKEIPFDEDVMTLIMGLGGPEKPGQHGRVNTPKPDRNTIDLITEIRDMCDEFLQKCGKTDEESHEEDKADKGDEDEEKPEEEE